MKFSHLADCHIGGWNDEKLKQIGMEAFRQAIRQSINENVGFIIIAGDLFNTALPQMDLVKEVAGILDGAREANISVYVVAGSHDCSPSGKTMLDVLEQAGLLVNVSKFKDNKLQFTIDKTGVKLTGLPGKRSGLEIEDYKKLDKTNLENEPGTKIFLFHTTLDEFKPKDLEMVEGLQSADLPKNFTYYAGGHVHYIYDVKKENYGIITFPGALFPNNFKELEEFKHGGFYVVNINEIISYEWKPVKIKEVINFNIDVNGLNAEEATQKIINETKEDITDKIVTLRVKGILKGSKLADIKIKDILSRLDNAYIVLRNMNKVSSEDIEEIKIEEGSIENVERKLIQDIEFGNELTKALMDTLNCEKEEGEKVADFEKRVINHLDTLFKIDN